MNNRTLNRLLISTICFLCLIICLLILLILSRPHHITTQGSAATSFDEIPATEILPFDTPITNDIQEETSVNESVSEPVSNELYARTTCLVNIRATNSTDAQVLATIEENTVLQVLQIQQDGWTKVLFEGKEAYISSAYIILLHNE